jgi:hypothetical protein
MQELYHATPQFVNRVRSSYEQAKLISRNNLVILIDAANIGFSGYLSGY